MPELGIEPRISRLLGGRLNHLAIRACLDTWILTELIHVQAGDLLLHLLHVESKQ